MNGTTSTQSTPSTIIAVLGIIGVIAVFYLMIWSLSLAFIQNTHQQVFALEPNETFTFQYGVHNTQWLVRPDESTMRGEAIIAAYGYLIASTGTPGSYRMIVTTNRPEDLVYLTWRETFTENELVGDKFGKTEVAIQKEHWIGGRVQACKSDKYSDCNITMVEGQYQNPELQVYIYGDGSGNITIWRLE